jgi:S1-C subfamily serine protease
MSRFLKPTWVDAVIIAAVVLATIISQNVDGNSSSFGGSNPSTVTATVEANTSSSGSQGSGGSGSSSVSQQSNTPPEECTFRDHYDRIRGSLVEIVNIDREKNEVRGMGTGFHIGDGIYITALHVVDSAYPPPPPPGSTATPTPPKFSGTVSDFIIIGSWKNQKIFEAQVIDFGDYDFGQPRVGKDIAVLRSETISDAISIRFPSELDISSETQYRAFGFPGSAVPDNIEPGNAYPGQKPTTQKNSLSKIISGAVEYVQFGNAVDKGMSGGPLVDQCGAVLAVISGGVAGSPFDFGISISEYK